MTEIYYCKNEDDMKRVAIHIFQYEYQNSGADDALQKSCICGCDYANMGCNECELDGCLLCDKLDKKDVHKHIDIDMYTNDDIEYPCVVCVADTYDSSEKVTVCSISDAKENTKYGCY